jgi:putative ABC transport system substrate-binding protein
LAEIQIRDSRVAAQALGLTLRVFDASSESEIDDAFAEMSRLKVSALMVGIDPLFGFGRQPRWVELASRYRIPTIYGGRQDPVAGGLVSYGPNLSDTWRQAGIYVRRILKGERPSDLPIVQPTKFELVINLKTAKQLGIDIPAAVLARADEVIE